MGTIKGIVTKAVASLVSVVALVIGYNAASTIWENGLGDKVAEKTQKAFSKKKEED